MYVECTFGMPIQWWSILCWPLPAAMGLNKIIALTMCLCTSHNFLTKKKVARSLLQGSAQGMLRGQLPFEKHQTFPWEVVPE